jgi:hypothetical protein
MQRPLKPVRVALLAGAALAWTAVGAPVQAAPAKKSVKKVEAAAKPAPPKPLPPIKITCGAPLPQADDTPAGKKPKKPKKGEPKLPDACVLARFLDTAFPPSDPNARGRAAVGLFGGAGPVGAEWKISTAQFQQIADDVADAGPRPDLRATVKVANMSMAEAHAIYEENGGRGGAIVLSTRLIQSLRDLSVHVSKTSTEDPDQLTQDYLRFVIAHEYAHLLLNHPQSLDKADSLYQQIGQGLKLAGEAYVIINQVKAGSDEAYAEKRARTKEAAAVMLAANFAGDIASTEGKRFLFPIFNRAVERDADMLAVDILNHSNGDPIKGVSGLQIFYDQNKENVKRNGQLSEESRKTAEKAAAQITAIAPELLNGDKNSTSQKLKMIAIGVGATFAARKLEEHKMMVDAHLHDSPKERDQLVNAYVVNFYGRARFAASTVAPIAAFPTAAGQPAAAPAAVTPAPEERRIIFTKVDFKKVGAEVDGYEATEAAKDAMARGDLREARRRIDVALKSPIQNTVDVQWVAGGVAQAEGQQDAAIKHFRAVLATGYNAVEVFHEIIESQRIKGDNASALKTIADGVAKTSQLGAFILDRIEIHRAQNDEKALAADLEACRGLKDPRLASQCEAAAAPPPPPVNVAQAAPPPASESMLDKMVKGAASAVGKKTN